MMIMVIMMIMMTMMIVMIIIIMMTMMTSIWQKQEEFNSFNATDLYYMTFGLRTAMSRNIIFPKFARPLLFSLISFLACRNKHC